MTRTRATIFLQGCKIKDQVASLKKLVASAIRYVTYLKTFFFCRTFRPSVPHSSGTETRRGDGLSCERGWHALRPT